MRVKDSLEEENGSEIATETEELLLRRGTLLALNLSVIVAAKLSFLPPPLKTLAKVRLLPGPFEGNDLAFFIDLCTSASGRDSMSTFTGKRLPN